MRSNGAWVLISGAVFVASKIHNIGHREKSIPQCTQKGHVWRKPPSSRASGEDCRTGTAVKVDFTSLTRVNYHIDHSIISVQLTIVRCTTRYFLRVVLHENLFLEGVAEPCVNNTTAMLKKTLDSLSAKWFSLISNGWNKAALSVVLCILLGPTASGRLRGA